jgi:hypothetical protein
MLDNGSSFAFETVMSTRRKWPCCRARARGFMTMHLVFVLLPGCGQQCSVWPTVSLWWAWKCPNRCDQEPYEAVRFAAAIRRATTVLVC